MRWLKIDRDLVKAKNYALRLLTYRQRSQHEIKNRLEQKGYDQCIIEQTLDFLKDCKLIDDYQFAQQYIYNKISSAKPVGVNRMKYELVQLGIDKDIVSDAVATIDYQTELDLAKKLVKRTINNKTSPPKSQKLVALLLRRGFSYNIIKEALRDFDLDVT
ncbi:regulatory protein RecX [Peptococcaceae bacterium 1198_IL3148]